MEKIALLPGGFKPPHAGHYNAAKWLAKNTDADSVIIKVGSGVRGGISREMSLQLWNLYRTTDKDPLANKISVLPSESPSPVRDVYDFVEKEAPEGSEIYLGLGEKDASDKRYANIGKFAKPRNIKTAPKIIPPQDGGISGEVMRGFIEDGDKVSFFNNLPKHLSTEQKGEAWNIVYSATPTQKMPIDPRAVSQMLEEDLYNPKDKVNDYMRSSEYKAGMPDGSKDDIDPSYRYKRGGVYGKMYEKEGRKKLRVYDFDDTLAITRGANIKIKHADGSIDTLNPAEFATYKGQSGDKFDFTEFDRVIKDATPIQNIVSMLRKDLNDRVSKVTVLTARLLAYPVSRYLREELNLDVYVIAVGSSDPKDKADWIEDHIKKGYDDVMFIDDSKPNRDAVIALEDKYPNIELSVFNPDSLQEMLGTMNDQEKAKHAKNLKRLKKYTAKQGDQYVPVPDFIKGTLTRKLSEVKLFSKDWWLNILTEGGAAGHMAHPFNLPNVNSGKDLLDIFEKTSNSLDKNPGAVKIDGVNASIRLVNIDGKKQFALDRGSKQALDLKGVTKDDLEDRFKTKDGTPHGFIKTGGEVLDMFNEALPVLKKDLIKLGAWENPNILFNMEYVSGQTNVQKYDNNFIAIHGLNKIEMVDEPSEKTGKMLSRRKSKEIPYNKNDLQSLLDNLKPIAEKRGFEVYGSVPTEMKRKPNFTSALSKNYTIKFTEEDKTQSLNQWLSDLKNIPEEDLIFMNDEGMVKKKVGAVSKLVYTTLLNGGVVDKFFNDEKDQQKAIEGWTTYLATEKLGDEILKVLDSPMGSAENHEGVVIRDENISNVPFKITGKFILGGLQTGFR